MRIVDVIQAILEQWALANRDFPEKCQISARQTEPQCVVANGAARRVVTIEVELNDAECHNDFGPQRAFFARCFGDLCRRLNKHFKTGRTMVKYSETGRQIRTVDVSEEMAEASVAQAALLAIPIP